MSNNINNQKGQSLIELIVAMSVFILVVSSIMFLVLDAHMANRQGGERSKATLFTEEGIEAALSIAGRGWRYVIDGDHGIDDGAGYWDWQGTSDAIDSKYTRKVTVEPVYRDGSGNIVDAGGTLDIDSKLVTSLTTWDFTTARPSEVSITTLLVNWRSIKWLQTLQAEFDLGIKSQTVSTLVDDGEVVLAQAVTSDINDWPFNNPANYSYNPADIEVVGSQGRLVNIGSITGSTLNSGFDGSEASWVYSDWNQDPGEVNVDGRWRGNFGQSGGGVEIKVPRGRNFELGGYYEQSFTIINSSPSFITATLSWMVNSFRGSPQNFEVMAFVDSASGEPLHGTEIWTSGLITGTTSWDTEAIDLTSVLTTPGTFYFKIAIWVETDNSRAGAFETRFDDVSVTWDTGQSAYRDTEPTIEPVSSLIPVDLISWTGFQEIAMKNGGEIYYQLSDDDGVTWYYWDGGSWSAAGAFDYNTAVDVNNNITQYPTTNNKFTFRAFLSSDGTQLVILDNIRVLYERFSATTYATVGTFESLNFNTGSPSVVYNYLIWTIDEPSNTNIEFQLRTAGSQAQLPSAIWVGPDGTGATFYTVQETFIELDPGRQGDRWIQYKAYLYSDGNDTPVLKDITIDYEN